MADPTSPYDFDQIPVSILGSIYERFLGKVVHATAKTVKIEEKPEVRKSGGVYYTPEYIVRYIVGQTVGKQIAGKTPQQISSMAFADLSCGSGSFLIEVYSQLIDYHIRYYSTSPDKAKKGDVFERDGRLLLTLKKKKEILTNSIFGIDIDYQATEVTQLSLYLKLLEEVTMDDAHQFGLFKETILPDLRKNIVCGNSLIGTEFEGLFLGSTAGGVRSINISEIFPNIFQRGGFDAIVGNPPYVRQEAIDQSVKEYFESTYSSYSRTADLYVYFYEKAIKLLRPNSGILGLISANKYIRSTYGRKLREFITKNTSIRLMVDFGELPVFQGAATFPAILVLQKQKVNEQQFRFLQVKSLDFESLDDLVETQSAVLGNESLEGDYWTLATAEELQVFDKMRLNSVPFGEYVDWKIYSGVKTGYNEAFVIDDSTRSEIIKADPKCDSLIKKFAVGDDIRRFGIRYENRYLILIPSGWTKRKCGHVRKAHEWFAKNYRPLYEHLKEHSPSLKKRYDQGDFWWELRPCDYYEAFESPKIVFPDIAKESRMAFDTEGIYVGNTAYVVPVQDMYLLGILNSRLVYSYYKRNSAVLGDADKGGRLRWIYQDVVNIPIRAVDNSNAVERDRRDKIVDLVSKIIDTKRQISSVNTEAEEGRLMLQVESFDSQLDEAVFEAYGLTKEEREIVEKGFEV